MNNKVKYLMELILHNLIKKSVPVDQNPLHSVEDSYLLMQDQQQKGVYCKAEHSIGKEIKDYG